MLRVAIEVINSQGTSLQRPGLGARVTARSRAGRDTGRYYVWETGCLRSLGAFESFDPQQGSPARTMEVALPCPAAAASCRKWSH